MSSNSIVFCSHSISSGRWIGLNLSANGSRTPEAVSILDALSTWLTLDSSGHVRYSDACEGTCNIERWEWPGDEANNYVCMHTKWTFHTIGWLGIT